MVVGVIATLLAVVLNAMGAVMGPATTMVSVQRGPPCADVVVATRHGSRASLPRWLSEARCGIRRRA